MKGTISLLSVPLLIASGASLGQEPQALAQEEVPRAAERNPEIAAADTRSSGDFLTRMEQSHIRSDTLAGSNLLDAEGEDIGDVDALLIDVQSGRVEALLVDVGGIAGIGDRTVALSWDVVAVTRTEEEDGVLADGYEVRTQLSREQLEDAPEFEGPDDDQIIDDL